MAQYTPKANISLLASFMSIWLGHIREFQDRYVHEYMSSISSTRIADRMIAGIDDVVCCHHSLTTAPSIAIRSIATTFIAAGPDAPELSMTTMQIVTESVSLVRYGHASVVAHESSASSIGIRSGSRAVSRS